MSGSLPDNDYHTIQGRLDQLERRLERAKQLRDNYLEVMRTEHPTLYNTRRQFEVDEFKKRSVQNSPQMPSEFQNAVDDSMSLFQNRTSLMRRLETAKYFWNDRRGDNFYSKDSLPVNDPMPTGLVLTSDMKNLQGRLKQIGSEIRNLREYRLSAPTSQYFGVINPSLSESETSRDLPSVSEIRHRILQMDLNIEKRAREMLTEANRQRLLIIKEHNTPDIVLEDPLTFLTENMGIQNKIPEFHEDHMTTVIGQDGNNNKVQSLQNFENVNKEKGSDEKRGHQDERTDELQPQIAPSRNLIFDERLKKASEASSYSKMLNILKAPQSNETSEDEAEPPPKSGNLSFVSQPSQPSRPAFQPNPFSIQEPPKKITLQDQDVDSDSDFFR